MLKKLVSSSILLLCSLPAFAGSAYYTTTYTFTLSGTAGVITLQLPRSAKVSAKLIGLSLDTTSDFYATLERNGSPASLTFNATNLVNPVLGSVSSSTLAFVNSNSTGGAVIGNYIVGAGSRVIDLSRISLDQGNNIIQNITFRSSTMTGQVAIVWMWEEL